MILEIIVTHSLNLAQSQYCAYYPIDYSRNPNKIKPFFTFKYLLLTQKLILKYVIYIQSTQIRILEFRKILY